jgi:hypothetical protein
MPFSGGNLPSALSYAQATPRVAQRTCARYSLANSTARYAIPTKNFAGNLPSALSSAKATPRVARRYKLIARFFAQACNKQMLDPRNNPLAIIATRHKLAVEQTRRGQSQQRLHRKLHIQRLDLALLDCLV